MSNAGALLVGALAVAAFLGLSAAMVTLAPYVAGVVVIGGVCWLFLRKEESSTSSTLPTQHDPRE